MSTWVKNIKNQDEADAIIEARKAKIRQQQNAWAKANRDRANAYKKATKERKRSVVVMTTSNKTVVKSRYRADFRASVYNCPELTYRGKHND